MKAGVLVGPGKIDVREVPKPSISGPGQVLIKNTLSTICGSDTHVLWGMDPSTWSEVPGYPGHESVGTVEDSSDPAIAAGDMVLAVPNLKYAGGFAEFQALPSSLVIPLHPRSIPEKVILAQQLGTVIYGMKRFHTTTGNGTVGILGQGPVGLFFASLCRLAGFTNIIVSDLHNHRLETARKMGATHTVVADGDAVVKLARDVSPDGVFLVIDASGTNEARVQSIEMVAISGRLGWFGMPEGDEMTVPFEKLYRRKPTVEFCWDAQAEPGHMSFKEAISHIENDVVDVSPITMRTWGLDDVQDALDAAHEHHPGFTKAGIRF
jgi:L-iditol 2-dehydrogenase